MPFVAAPNIVQVEVRATHDSIPVENRFYVNVFHTPVAADLTAISGLVAGTVNNAWRPLLPANLNVTEVHLKSMQTQNDIQLTVPFAIPSPGTATGQSLPNNVTVCASLRSGFTGRSARGRLYWMGLTEAQVTENQVEPTPLAAILAAVDEIRTDMISLGFAWTIVSFVSGGIPRPGGPVYFLVQEVLFVDNRTDSQRGRSH